MTAPAELLDLRTVQDEAYVSVPVTAAVMEAPPGIYDREPTDTA